MDDASPESSQEGKPEQKKIVSPTKKRPLDRKNVVLAALSREGGDPKYHNRLAPEFQQCAEEQLIKHFLSNSHSIVECQLPDLARSTYLMAFSRDGKMVASCHGNHKIYVTDMKTGKNLKTLSGHPRTPWCIEFHPTSSQILASGCLGGQVRVWDLHGGSATWTIESKSVIASLAFHPASRLLVIASSNELLFWDWNEEKPKARCSTQRERERVRYVAFDYAGQKLITGISNKKNSADRNQDEPVVVTSNQSFGSRLTVPSTRTGYNGLWLNSNGHNHILSTSSVSRSSSDTGNPTQNAESNRLHPPGRPGITGLWIGSNGHIVPTASMFGTSNSTTSQSADSNRSIFPNRTGISGFWINCNGHISPTSTLRRPNTHSTASATQNSDTNRSNTIQSRLDDTLDVPSFTALFTRPSVHILSGNGTSTSQSNDNQFRDSDDSGPSTSSSFRPQSNGTTEAGSSRQSSLPGGRSSLCNCFEDLVRFPWAQRFSDRFSERFSQRSSERSHRQTTFRNPTDESSTSVRDRSPLRSSPSTSARDRSPMRSSPSTSARDRSPLRSSPSTSVRDRSPLRSLPSTSARDRSPLRSSSSTSVRDRSPLRSLPSTSGRDRSPLRSSPSTSNLDTSTTDPSRRLCTLCGKERSDTSRQSWLGGDSTNRRPPLVGILRSPHGSAFTNIRRWYSRPDSYGRNQMCCMSHRYALNNSCNCGIRAIPVRIVTRPVGRLTLRSRFRAIVPYALRNGDMSSATQTSSAQTSSAQTSTAETSTAETSTAQPSTAQASTALASTAQASTAQASTAQASSDQTSSDQTRTAQTRTDQTSTAQTSTAQTSMAQTSTAQTSTAQTSTAQTSTAQTSSAQTSTAQTSTAQTSTAQTSTAQTSMAQTSTAQTSTAQMRTAQRGSGSPVSTDSNQSRLTSSVGEFLNRLQMWQQRYISHLLQRSQEVHDDGLQSPEGVPESQSDNVTAGSSTAETGTSLQSPLPGDRSPLCHCFEDTVRSPLAQRFYSSDRFLRQFTSRIPTDESSTSVRDRSPLRSSPSTSARDRSPLRSLPSMSVRDRSPLRSSPSTSNLDLNTTGPLRRLCTLCGKERSGASRYRRFGRLHTSPPESVLESERAVASEVLEVPEIPEVSEVLQAPGGSSESSSGSQTPAEYDSNSRPSSPPASDSQHSVTLRTIEQRSSELLQEIIDHVERMVFHQSRAVQTLDELSQRLGLVVGDASILASGMPRSPLTAPQLRPSTLNSPNGQLESPDRSRQDVPHNELITHTLELLSRRVRDLRQRQEDELGPAISAITQSTREWRDLYKLLILNLHLAEHLIGLFDVSHEIYRIHGRHLFGGDQSSNPPEETFFGLGHHVARTLVNGVWEVVSHAHFVTNEACAAANSRLGRSISSARNSSSSVTSSFLNQRGVSRRDEASSSWQGNAEDLNSGMSLWRRMVVQIVSNRSRALSNMERSLRNRRMSSIDPLRLRPNVDSNDTGLSSSHTSRVGSQTEGSQRTDDSDDINPRIVRVRRINLDWSYSGEVPLSQRNVRSTRRLNNDVPRGDSDSDEGFQQNGPDLRPSENDHISSASHAFLRPVPLVRLNDMPIPENEMNGFDRDDAPPRNVADEDAQDEDANPFRDNDSNHNNLRDFFYSFHSFHQFHHFREPFTFSNNAMTSNQRIQAWDFSQGHLPDLTSINEQNLVVPECRINNDASVDISSDGQFLVAFLCVPNYRASGRQFVGVYSLRWDSLGQVLYRHSFDQVPVSVSLSPTSTHLLIGLASRRPPFPYQPAQAQVFRLERARPGRVLGAMGRLLRVCTLKLGTDRRPEGDTVSLNCIRWSAVAGQGLAFGTNTGQLTLLR